MKIYTYCAVIPDGLRQPYYYIYPFDDEINPGDKVLVPVGPDDSIMIGTVCTSDVFDENNVPFPVEFTKAIRSRYSEDDLNGINDDLSDYDEIDSACDCNKENCKCNQSEADEDEVAEVEELQSFVDNADFDSVFEWAYDHHESKSSYIMQHVVAAYELCIEENMPVAALNLGTIYYCGVYLPQDFRRAVELYEIAAQGGEVEAICNLGYCWYYGRHYELDFKRAYEYFSLGALLYDHSNCLYKLGDMYRSGLYVEKNEKYAFRLYERAYEQIDYEDNRIADIELRLGSSYFYGCGVEADIDVAYDYLCSALKGFYSRRKSDPFVSTLILNCKSMVSDCEAIMEMDFIK